MPWHNWRVPTFADDPAHDGTTTPLPCPQCGRRVTADMLLPVAMLPASVRERWWRKADVAYACDACRALLYHSGDLAPADHLRFLKAPAHVLTRLDAVADHPGRGRHDAALAAHLAKGAP